MARPSGHRLASHTKILMEGGLCPESITSFHIGNRWSSEYIGELALALSSRDRGRPSVKGLVRGLFSLVLSFAPKERTDLCYQQRRCCQSVRSSSARLLPTGRKNSQLSTLNYKRTLGTFSQQIFSAAVLTSVNLKSLRYCLSFSAAPFSPT